MPRGRLSRTLALAAMLSVAACARTAGAPEPLVGTRMLPVSPAPRTELFGPSRPLPARVALPEVAWAKTLPPLHVECANTGAKLDLRLYESDGSVDLAAVDTFSEVATDPNHGEYPLHPRVVQLAVKAARHFGATSLTIVSAYRKPRRKDSADRHSHGEALDFRLAGVDYRQLAAYLRSLPRVGVGVYTDRRTHYVHLDVREKSFHWLDASPPGVTWREAAIPDAKRDARDAAYSEESDLPL